MKKMISQEKYAESLNAMTKKGLGIDCERLNSLMDGIIEKAKEIQSECVKEHPEMWRLCDLAIDDLERLFDEVSMCVFARCMRETDADRGRLPMPDIARFYKSVNALPEE